MSHHLSPGKAPISARSLIGIFVALALALVALGSSRPVQADPNHPSAGVDYQALGDQLQGEGLVGWMHAVVPEQGLYVFTWRDPKTFFTSAEFPLVSHIPGMMDRIKALHRHDKVLVKGEFLANGAPQRHIYVTDITLLTPFGGAPADPYTYKVKVPDDLKTQHDLIAKVHAVDANGHVLVIEYKDVVLPVYVERDSDAAQIKDYWRGDEIRLHYVLRSYPHQPQHLSPDAALAKPIELVHKIAEINNKPADLEGSLVMFPKSPEINFDVYALQATDANGVTYDYTLVNLTDQAVFQAIRAKLAAAYNSNSMNAVNGRNKFIEPHVKVHAVGTFLEVSPAQANPQIQLKSADDLHITVK